MPQVHCVGHLVCAVVADSDIQAKQAAKLVKIVYQDLKPLILTIEVWVQAGATSGGRRAEMRVCLLKWFGIKTGKSDSKWLPKPRN